MPVRIDVLIMSAGRGTRYGKKEIKKQFLDLNGKTVLARSVDLFKNIEFIENIMVVYPPDMTEEKTRQVSGVNNNRINFIRGRKKRVESVRQGLAGVNSEYVMVHDSVRPACPKKLIINLIEQIKSFYGIIPGVHPVSTLKYKTEKRVKTLDRTKTYIIQTPQLYKTEILKNGYGKLKNKDVTDSSSVVETAGYDVNIVEGSRKNIKITYPEDLEYLKGVVQ